MLPGKAQYYKQTDIETADRGRLLLMIYDHCIKWCQIAIDAIQNHDIAQKNMALIKVQNGLTELLCSLDYEKGGEIAKNLAQLYDFYSRHLIEANIKNSIQNIQEVKQMLESLREAWELAIQNIRQNKELAGRLQPSGQHSYISMVG